MDGAMGSRAEDLDALIAAITAGSPAVQQAAERLHAAPWGQLGAPGDRQKVDQWLLAVMNLSRIVCDQPHSSSKELGAQLHHLAATIHEGTPGVPSTPSV